LVDFSSIVYHTPRQVPPTSTETWLLWWADVGCLYHKYLLAIVTTCELKFSASEQLPTSTSTATGTDCRTVGDKNG